MSEHKGGDFPRTDFTKYADISHWTNMVPTRTEKIRDACIGFFVGCVGVYCAQHGQGQFASKGKDIDAQIEI